MTAPGCIQRQHLRAASAFAERVQHGGRLGVSQRRLVLQLGQRGLGSVEVGAQDPSLVAGSKVERPARVGLVFEDLAADKGECILQRRASRMS